MLWPALELSERRQCDQVPPGGDAGLGRFSHRWGHTWGELVESCLLADKHVEMIGLLQGAMAGFLRIWLNWRLGTSCLR